jgi:hypothetical protein
MKLSFYEWRREQERLLSKMLEAAKYRISIAERHPESSSAMYFLAENVQDQLSGCDVLYRKIRLAEDKHYTRAKNKLWERLGKLGVWKAERR